MSSTWRCLILASTHRVGGSGPPGEVGGEAHHENESSREARTAELQEFLVTSSSSDGGGDEEGEQGSGTRRLSVASSSTPSAWGRSSCQPSNVDEGTSMLRKTLRTNRQRRKVERGCWESKTNYEVSRDGDHTVTCDARQSLEVQVNRSGCSEVQRCTTR
jgi:hypothetical protein